MPHKRLIIRRRLCQACFCLGCLLPTTVLLGWTVSRKLPAHVRRCEDDLGRRLGLVVRLRGIKYPQPGLTVYQELEVYDPETGQRVLDCQSLEAADSGQTLVLDPFGASVQLEQVGNLARLVMRRLRREALTDDRGWHSPPRSITLRGPRGEQTYEEVEFSLESAEGAECASLRFRLPQQQGPDRATLSVTRRASTESATTRIELDTGGVNLPLAIFAPWLDCQSLFGADARFCGSLWIDDAPDGNRGELRGDLSAINLDALVAARFPHILTGSATLHVEHATLEGGKVVEASGRLSSPSGMVGASLVDAAVSMLGCRWADARLARLPAQHREYQSLDIDFQIDAGALRLGGPRRAKTTHAAAATAILLDAEGRPLLFAPAKETVPLVWLVQMLAPRNDVQVPATKETASLIPWLPLMPSGRGAGGPVGDPSSPAARVRLESVR